MMKPTIVKMTRIHRTTRLELGGRRKAVKGGRGKKGSERREGEKGGGVMERRGEQGRGRGEKGRG